MDNSQGTIISTINIGRHHYPLEAETDAAQNCLLGNSPA